MSATTVFDSAIARGLLAPLAEAGNKGASAILKAATGMWADRMDEVLSCARDGELGALAYDLANALPNDFGCRPMTAEELKADADAQAAVDAKYAAEDAKQAAVDEFFRKGIAECRQAEAAGRAQHMYTRITDAGSPFDRFDGTVYMTADGQEIGCFDPELGWSIIDGNGKRWQAAKNYN